MKKTLYLLFLATTISFAQEVTTDGFLIPRKTTAERLAFPPNTARGTLIYDLDLKHLLYDEIDGRIWALKAM